MGQGRWVPHARIMPPRKKIVAHRNQKARAQARKHLGTLQDLTIGQIILARYNEQVAAFLMFRMWLGLAIPFTFEQLEHQLCAYLEYMWVMGLSKSQAGFFLSGVQHALNVKKKFGAAWRLFAAWARMEPKGPGPTRVARTRQLG